VNYHPELGRVSLRLASLGANHLLEVSKFGLASLVHQSTGKFLDRIVAAHPRIDFRCAAAIYRAPATVTTLPVGPATNSGGISVTFAEFPVLRLRKSRYWRRGV